jgi:peptidoglycan/xylan/chitin deacetylase (PgdA/CDA1 family)
MAETRYALTNDDAGGQEPELFAELLDFLRDQEVPATFFVVPATRGRPLDEDPVWLRLLERALSEGHELQLHGYNHGAFEFGVPPAFMLDIMPAERARWLAEPKVIGAQHQQALLADMLAKGKDILYRALKLEPVGFRSGCLATCDAMYHALAATGIAWSSNQVVNPMGWRYINRDYGAGDTWQRDVPPWPFRATAGLIELPILSEYTWFLQPEDEERHYQLARGDYDRVRGVGGAFIVLSHYYAMTGKWATGLTVHRRLFEYARERGEVRFCTQSQLYEGALAQGAARGAG